ncbi:MAG TPA: hypothetical protein VL563_17050 [Gemmatimonadales bacterium]|nr:hypothetical protein [Gemmatimonadales bacterium]
MTRIVFRHIVLAFLPLAIGIGAGWVFIYQQPSCGSMVGPLFSAKCGRMLVQYQLWFQTMGTGVGAALVASLGIWLERRRERKRSAARVLVEEPTPDTPA